MTHAALFGRATCRIALHEEKLGLGMGRVLGSPRVCPQRGRVERAFAPRKLPRLAGRFAGRRRFHDLADIFFASAGWFLEPCRKHVADDEFPDGLHFGETVFPWFCEENLGSAL